MLTPFAIIALMLMITCTVVGNLLLKLGMASQAGTPLIWALFEWRVLLGLAVLATAICIYAWLLSFVPLNVVQSFASAQFIVVILASSWFLNEPIQPLRWAGIGLIALGIFLVGFTVNSGR